MNHEYEQLITPVDPTTYQTNIIVKQKKQKKTKITSMTLVKWSFITMANIYGLFSVIALCIGLTYHNVHTINNIQPALLLESSVALFTLIYMSSMNISDPKCYDFPLLTMMSLISYAYIFIGMILVWEPPYVNSPYILYIFPFIYFNLWWVLVILGLIELGVLCLIYRKEINKSKIETHNVSFDSNV